MSRHFREWLTALSLVVLFVLWSLPASIQAQVPTKTPIGPPPTKTPLSEIAPTKTPLPDVLPTKTPLPTESVTPNPTVTLRPTTIFTSASARSELPTVTSTPVPTVVSVTPVHLVPTDTSAAMMVNVAPTGIAGHGSSMAVIATANPPITTLDPAASILPQVVNIGGLVIGLALLGLFIWFGLSRLGRSITNEIRTVSLATLRLQHEAERLARREKVAFRADSEVLALLEQAILDASGESVRLRLLPNGWLSSPPLLAVVDHDQRRYLFSPLPPDQVKNLVRRNGLAQFLLGEATDLTAYPIDAVTSTPFIADDLTDAFGSVLARHQAQRRPLPRTDRWYLYVARPKTSRWSRWLTRYATQRNRLKRLMGRLSFKTHSDAKPKRPTRTGD